jgi:hypothetical protein
MNIVVGYTILSAIIAMLVWLLVYRLRKHIPDQERIAEWAEMNGVVILATERRRFWKGPFFAHNGLVVYRIRVRDSEGHEREGWLCIANFLFGLDTEVRWS